MKPKSNAIIFDVDGTLFMGFENFDKLYVRHVLFKDFFLVKLIDVLLWKINILEFFSNSAEILSLRFKIYSFLTFGKLTYEEAYAKYAKAYKRYMVHLVGKDIIQKGIKELKQLDIMPIAVSNNPFAKEGIQSTLDIECIITCQTLKNRTKVIKSIIERYDILYWIGNNFFDDIVLPHAYKVKTIYVGKSKLKKLFSAKHYASNIEEVIRIVQERLKNSI